MPCQRTVGGAGASDEVVVRESKPQRTPDKARDIRQEYELPRGPEPVDRLRLIGCREDILSA